MITEEIHCPPDSLFVFAKTYDSVEREIPKSKPLNLYGEEQ